MYGRLINYLPTKNSTLSYRPVYPNFYLILFDISPGKPHAQHNESLNSMFSSLPLKIWSSNTTMSMHCINIYFFLQAWKLEASFDIFLLVSNTPVRVLLLSPIDFLLHVSLACIIIIASFLHSQIYFFNPTVKPVILLEL